MQKKPARTKRPKQVRTPRQRLLHILFIVATVLAAIVVAVFIGWNLFAKEPERPVYTPRPQASANQGETGETENSGEAPGQISGDRKDDFWTFLLVGQDTFGGGNTDTMMLVSYDIPNQKLSVLSLPRDTMVNVSWDIKRLNSVYNYAPYYDKEGMEFLKEEIAQLVGYEPDFTVTIQWDAVGELVDAIGGVYFEVPFDMYYNDLSQNFKIDLKAGYQKLDGDQAMQLIRYRHNSIGDTGRIDSSYILNVYSNEKDEHYIGIFDGSRNVKFCGTVPYSEVMKKSAESDILIVVEGFKKKDVDITRYSLSTKVADSLSSGAAVFAYGSAECGAIEYAESTGCITTCTDKDMLEVSLRSLIYDTELQRRNYEKGITVVENNHRLENSTGIFESVVNGVCGDL